MSLFIFDQATPLYESIDLYVLDNEFRRVDIFDKYQSLIWTERYSDYGDFEFVITDTPETRSRLPLGTWVTILQSERVARIESFESKRDSNGERLLTYKGSFLEAILMDRASMPSFASLTTRSKWTIGPMTPGNIIRHVFTSILKNGALNAKDIIPFLQTGSVNPPGNISEPTETITVGLNPGNVMEQIKPICDAYNLGFRIVRREPVNPSNPISLYFEVYTGTGRTTSDVNAESVVFGESFDTLTNVTEIQSIANYRNVAYVFAMNGTIIVYADGVDTNISGFDRHVVYVDASDITTSAGATLNTEMTQRGKEVLAQQRPIMAFDGETPQSSRYIYRQNYNLGDKVEIRSEGNLKNQMYVTEQIFISDAEGVRSYPTLSFDRLITPGSWASWAAEKWIDVGADVWADLE